MEIGSRVYYEKETGNVIWVTSERSGLVVETTVEDDLKFYRVLAERVPETVGMLQLEYDAYAADYDSGGQITRIDLETMEPLFTYPDPTDPETPQEPRPALSAQVAALESETAALNLAIIDLWETLANGGAA